MGISIRAYARHRGVTDSAVHKAIRTGRITPEADGTIDPERADRDWARHSGPPKAGTRQSAVRVAEFDPFRTGHHNHRNRFAFHSAASIRPRW